MSITIEKSERFQTEYKNYYERISRIPGEASKKELENLLRKLITEVRVMDKQHLDLYRRNVMPAMIVDSRSRIQDIRKEIVRKLEDCERTYKV